MGHSAGLEPVDDNSVSAAQLRTNAAQPAHLLDLPVSQASGRQQNSAPSKQDQGTFSQKKRGICVGHNSALEKVVDMWDLLPPEVQTEILNLGDESLDREKRRAS
jgi:hypothetical protein